MPPSLDIGALAGRVELEDRFSSTADIIIGRIDKLDARFGGIGQRVAESAAGFFTAEVALQALQRGVTFLADTLTDLTVGGAGIADVVENFDALTMRAGRLSETLLSELREGTRATIADLDLIALANKDLAAGMELTDQQFRTLADGAFALAQATGKDVKSALDTMNDALLTGRTRTLAMLTGKIDLTTAEEKFAAALGTTRDRLTEEERLMAAREGILNSVAAATERLGAQTEGLDEIVAQGAAAWENFRNKLAANVATSPVLIAAFTSIRDSLAAAFGGDQRNAIETVTRLIENAAIRAIDFAQIVVDGVGVAGRTWNSFLIILDSVANGWRVIELGVVKLGQVILQVAETATFGFLGLEDSITSLGTWLDEIYDELATGVSRIEAHKKAQDEWSVSTGEVNEHLERIKQSMLEAQAAQDRARESTGQLSAAQGEAARKAAEHASAQSTVAVQTRMTAEEQKRLAEAVKNVAEAGTSWQAVLATLPQQLVDTVKEKLAAKAAAEDLAVAYGLTKAQITAITEAFREEQEALKKATDAAKKKEEALAELREIGQGWEETVLRLNAKTLEQAKAWLEAGAAADKVKIALGLTDSQIKAIQESMRSGQEATDAWTRSLQAGADVADATTVKVRTLAGEMVTLAEAQERQRTGGSFEINRGNLAENAKFWNVPETAAVAMAERGFSFQEIITAWQKQMVDTWVPSGPRVPGFREGGWGDFGEGALAMLHGREAIVPLDSPGGLGNVYVNVVAHDTQDAANKIADVLMQKAKLGRRFGAA